MAHAHNSSVTSAQVRSRLDGAMHALADAVADYALALRAAAQAESHRRRLFELRRMYLPTLPTK